MDKTLAQIETDYDSVISSTLYTVFSRESETTVIQKLKYCLQKKLIDDPGLNTLDINQIPTVLRDLSAKTLQLDQIFVSDAIEGVFIVSVRSTTTTFYIPKCLRDSTSFNIKYIQIGVYDENKRALRTKLEDNYNDYSFVSYAICKSQEYYIHVNKPNNGDLCSVLLRNQQFMIV